MGNVSTAFIESYRNVIRLLAQQKSSRLRKFVYFESTTGEKHFFDYLDTIEVNEVVDQFGDSPVNQAEHIRRACLVADFDAGTFMDKFDESKMIVDPKNKYVMNMHSAFGRKIDALIIKAALGAALTGKKGTTSVVLPASQKVDVTLGHDSGLTNAGCTVEKLRATRSIFCKNEVIDEENSSEEAAPIYVCSQQQIDDLLDDPQVTSSDYARVKALVDGKVNYFMGFRFLRTELVSLASATDIRSSFAFVPDGIGLCVNDDVECDISQRKDKKNAWYAYMMMSMGAARLEEKKVVEVPCDESPV